MWTIRQDQTEAFRQYHLRKFEDEMVDHLQKFSPHQFIVAGEPAVRQAIRLGIENAGKYGFSDRGPVRFYIELMFMFGGYFDSDPQHPWAAEVLTCPAIMEQGSRANWLHAATSQYLLDVIKPERPSLRQAVKERLSLPFEDTFPPEKNLEESLISIMHVLSPPRCKYAKDEVLRTLIRQAFRKAEKFLIPSNRGRVLMAVFTIAGGHGFDRDPLYGWISIATDHNTHSSVDERIVALAEKAQLYFGAMLIPETKD